VPGSILTFLIPVRHPENAKDWNLVKRNLTETTRSIAAQSDPRWSGFVVANRGSDLPTLPAGFEVIAVDFPPNPLHNMGSADLGAIYDAFRLDKGKRVLSGLVAAKPTGHVMICDDDDFVSRRLTEFVSTDQENPGWYIENGYVWAGGRLVYRSSDFSHECGTSHIIRSDLLGVPETAQEMTEEKIKRSLGSHVSIANDLKAAGTPLSPLPFLGAIYRIGHAGAHSQSKGLLHRYFFKSLIIHPHEVFDRLSRVAFLTPEIRSEFSVA